MSAADPTLVVARVKRSFPRRQEGKGYYAHEGTNGAHISPSDVKKKGKGPSLKGTIRRGKE